MAVGDTWVDAGTIRWTPASSNIVFEKAVEWTMEIVDVIDRWGVRAAIVTVSDVAARITNAHLEAR